MAFSYREVEDIIIKTFEGRRLRLRDKHTDTLESINTLIDLYDAWNKPEKAREWQVKLARTEAARE